MDVIEESLLELDSAENIPGEEYKGSHGKPFAAL